MSRGSRRDKNMRREKSREEVEMIGDVGKKERRKQAESNGGEKVFYMWKIWAYSPSLQKHGEREISIDALKQI